jgi:hypothetical protein
MDDNIQITQEDFNQAWDNAFVTYRRASPAASWLRNSNLLTLTP